MNEIQIISMLLSAFLTCFAWFLTIMETEYHVAFEELKSLQSENLKK